MLDADSVGRAWQQHIAALGLQIISLREDVQSSLRVNVIFHVPSVGGSLEWSGVRTGRFRTRDSWLQIQAAVPPEKINDARATLMGLLSEAIDEAERFGQRKRVSDTLDSLRGIVRALAE
jgi:hypothetical protein